MIRNDTILSPMAIARLLGASIEFESGLFGGGPTGPSCRITILETTLASRGGTDPILSDPIGLDLNQMKERDTGGGADM